MFLIKLILKIMFVPIVVAITLIQWVAIFLTSFSSVIAYLLSGLFFAIALLSYLMQIATGHEVIVMLITSFVIFIIPNIAEWLIVRIVALNELIKAFIRN